jgi:hypothetical protein
MASPFISLTVRKPNRWERMDLNPDAIVTRRPDPQQQPPGAWVYLSDGRRLRVQESVEAIDELRRGA